MLLAQSPRDLLTALMKVKVKSVPVPRACTLSGDEVCINVRVCLSGFLCLCFRVFFKTLPFGCFQFFHPDLIEWTSPRRVVFLFHSVAIRLLTKRWCFSRAAWNLIFVPGVGISCFPLLSLENLHNEIPNRRNKFRAILPVAQPVETLHNELFLNCISLVNPSRPVKGRKETSMNDPDRKDPRKTRGGVE